MSSSLLTTKLYMPPVSPRLVPRPQLIQQLDEGLHWGHRLTLASAPAGFGKTTLLSDWLRQADRPVAWLSLDDGDNDPMRFLAYLIAALQKIDPAIGQTAQATLQAPHSPSMESLLTSLVNDIAAISQPFILVLDDYHVIEVASVHEVVSFLLDHLPPSEQGIHLVIATRADPPLPLARLRARGQLTELHTAELRFSPDEAAAFLNEAMGLALSAEQVDALEERTEGWATGLQLAALSLRGREDVPDFIRAFTGSHRYVLEYLTEEVLLQQSERIQSFLVQTAILDRLSGPLCDAVTGQVDSYRTLEALEAANLFIVPLDDERRWYRYHHLFADLLRQRLQREIRDLLPELHRRACEWYEENGLIPEAVSHALASGDLERAADLIEWTAWTTLTRGEVTTLRGWLDRLPDQLTRSRPQIGVLHAWSRALAGQLDDVELQLHEVDVQQVQGDVAAVRAHVAALRGDVPLTIELAHRALERLPEKKWFSRVLVALSLGTVYWSSGELAAASQAMTEAICLSRAAGRTYLTMFAMATLGHVQEMQGLLHQAVDTHREALELAGEPGTRTVPFASVAYVGIAEVLYEWNDLDGAMRYAIEGIELSELGGRVSYVLAGRIVLARVHWAQGEVDTALEMLQGAESLTKKHDYAYLMAEVAELQVRLWVMQGNVAEASRWAREHTLSPVDEPGLALAREVEQMAAAWVLLAQGKAGEALKMLAQLLDPAEGAGRMRTVIKVLALQALVFQALADGDQALCALERALSLAEPEGYVRTFVDAGEPMAGLLRRALKQGIAPNYASRLLTAFGESAEPGSPVAQPLVEPLTERELEVLHLIAAGLSNREIAQELVIAVSTVKTHINRIYGKLDAKSRTQAVAKAQALDLL